MKLVFRQAPTKNEITQVQQVPWLHLDAQGVLAVKPKTTKIVDDPTSPDGIRVVMGSEDWQLERQRAADAAKNLCEQCSPTHYLPYPNGQLHHRLGRGGGGGRRDDRRLVPMQTIETEPNLARWRWFRGLVWTCAIGHDQLEREATKTLRQSLKSFCSCGLLRF